MGRLMLFSIKPNSSFVIIFLPMHLRHLKLNELTALKKEAN